MGNYSESIEYFETVAETFLIENIYTNASLSYILMGWVQTETAQSDADFDVAIGCYTTAKETALRETIIIAGKVLYGGKQTAPSNDNLIKLEIIVPDGKAPLMGRSTTAKTDDSGQFLLMPIAGWNTGKYEIIIAAKYLEGPNLWVSEDDTVTFQVNSAKLPDYIDVSPQMDKIMNHLSSIIPQGTIHTEEGKIFLNEKLKEIYGEHFE